MSFSSADSVDILARLQEHLATLQEGEIFELSDIPDWPWLSSGMRKVFGREFYKAVCEGKISGVVATGRERNGHVLYQKSESGKLLEDKTPTYEDFLDTLKKYVAALPAGVVFELNSLPGWTELPMQARLLFSRKAQKSVRDIPGMVVAKQLSSGHRFYRKEGEETQGTEAQEEQSQEPSQLEPTYEDFARARDSYIAALPAGSIIELHSLPCWKSLSPISRARFSRRTRKAVIAGEIPGLALSERRTSGHCWYQVTAKDAITTEENAQKEV